MSIDYYANIAEIIGVILVVVTLVFLTLQIRQNTRALRSTTIQSVMQSEVAMMSVMVENSATWEKILSGANIQPGNETRKAILLFNVYMIDTESRFHQYQTRLSGCAAVGRKKAHTSGCGRPAHLRAVAGVAWWSKPRRRFPEDA